MKPMTPRSWLIGWVMVLVVVLGGSGCGDPESAESIGAGSVENLGAFTATSTPGSTTTTHMVDVVSEELIWDTNGLVSAPWGSSVDTVFALVEPHFGDPTERDSTCGEHTITILEWQELTVQISDVIGFFGFVVRSSEIRGISGIGLENSLMELR